MAYCKSCGAYIPDGLTACLACGYDEAAEAQKTSAPNTGSAASAKSTQKSGGKEKYKQFDSDFLKQQLDEQRKRQQENSRKWAETEYTQRQKAKEEQARNFQSTSGRSTADNAYRSASDVYRSVRSSIQSDDTGKVLAGLSYFSVLFLLPYLFRSNDDFAMYHAKQGMTLFAVGVLADIVGSFLGFGWLVALLRIYMIFQGVRNVIKGKKKPLPYIGNLIK